MSLARLSEFSKIQNTSSIHKNQGHQASSVGEHAITDLEVLSSSPTLVGVEIIKKEKRKKKRNTYLEKWISIH